MQKLGNNQKTNNLFKAILALESVKETESFFRDLCTVEEIRAMAERWEIVRLLKNGLSYREISKKLNTSTTTVSRVSSWLVNGAGGYELIYNRLNKSTHHHNSSSVGKEL